MSTGLTNLSRLRLTGDDTEETVLQATDGVHKLHTRPAAGGYCLEVKSEPTIITGTHYGIECTVDAKPSASDTGAGVRGGGFIGRLYTGYTKTGGSLIGGYSQIQNNGTLNGSGIQAVAQYALIEDGGTWTAVGHVAVSWLDSHLDQTVSAGIKSFQYITNNGDTTFDNVFYVYAGNKITNLFTIESTTDGDLVSASTTSDYTFTKTRKIKINVGGVTCYLIADEV